MTLRDDSYSRPFAGSANGPKQETGADQRRRDLELLDELGARLAAAEERVDRAAEKLLGRYR